MPEKLKTLLVGGPFHSKIEMVEFHYGSVQFAIAKSPNIPLTLKDIDSAVFPAPYELVEYNHIGTVNTHYGPMEIAGIKGTKFHSVELYGEDMWWLQNHWGVKEDFAVFDKKPDQNKYLVIISDVALEVLTVFKHKSKVLIFPDSYGKWKAYEEAVLKTGQTITLKTVNEMMKSMYMGGVLTQLEAKSIFGMTLTPTDDDDWMHGGHRGSDTSYLCYDCAEELIWPGAGKLSPLRSHFPNKSKRKERRKMQCTHCGYGIFNKEGSKVASWEDEP